jgi:cytoskeletal protein CcmA (bactofilin family)
MRCGSIAGIGLAVVVGACPFIAKGAAISAANYAVFGGASVTFQGFADVSGAPVASNGDMHHTGGVGSFTGMFGAGALNPTPPVSWNARQRVSGDVVFNGPVNVNALSTIGGSLHSGGAVNSGADIGGDIVANGPVTVDIFDTITGSITANGNVSLLNGATVGGNVGANGAVSLGTDAHVTGTVTHNGNLTLGAFATVGGSQVGTVLPNPATYTPAQLPAATSFTSGSALVNLAVFENRVLSPNSYGAMTFAGANSLTLSPGSYYFDSISSPGAFVTLNLNLTGASDIRIFVTGDVQFNDLLIKVNGVAFDQADPALASLVYLESHGNIFHEREFFGTLHAPLGDVTTATISSVTGSIIAARHANLGSSADVIFVGSTYLGVPEPSGLLLAVGGFGVLAQRTRRLL